MLGIAHVICRLKTAAVYRPSLNYINPLNKLKQLNVLYSATLSRAKIIQRQW